MIINRIKNKKLAKQRKQRIAKLKSFGVNSNLPDSTDIAGYENISIGNHVYIGPRCTFCAGNAELVICDHVMLGPEVMIITGDHRIDVKGKRLDEITVDMKKPENDQPVVIKEDCWIGARALILKGVTIGSGSVIAAGAVVLQNVPDNTIYYSKGKMKSRF